MATLTNAQKQQVLKRFINENKDDIGAEKPELRSTITAYDSFLDANLPTRGLMSQKQANILLGIIAERRGSR